MRGMPFYHVVRPGYFPPASFGSEACGAEVGESCHTKRFWTFATKAISF